MPIIYSIISRGNTVLAEYTNNSGNFVQITRRILDRIPTSKPTKVSYVYDRYVFHCCVDDGLIFICMTDQEFPRRIPFAFLDDIKQKFRAAYGDRGRQALAYELNEDFKKVLQKQMETFSNDPQVDRISRVRAEIEDVKGIMLENIDKVLERGDRIEILVDKTATLVTQSWKFKEGAKELKCAMWWKNVKLWIIISIIVVLVIFFIVVGACGGFTFPKCGGPQSS